MLFTKILWKGSSKFNKNIKVVWTLGMGTYIQVNGLTQSGGIIESIWKQTLLKIRNSKFEIRNCLILGLGGGTVAKVIRKYWPQAKITGVEIDPQMIELGEKFLDLDRKEVEIVIGDAKKFDTNGFDMVIVDTFFGHKYADITGSDPAMSRKAGKSKSRQIFIFNQLFYGDKKSKALDFGEKLKKIFKKVDYYYPSVNIMFICYNNLNENQTFK